MAEYTFRRGKFGRWGVPMWAGETQALRFIRLLRKQGISGIKYEEGPLTDYSEYDYLKGFEPISPYKYINYRDLVETVKDCLTGQAPSYFKVTFKEV